MCLGLVTQITSCHRFTYKTINHCDTKAALDAHKNYSSVTHTSITTALQPEICSTVSRKRYNINDRLEKKNLKCHGCVNRNYKSVFTKKSLRMQTHPLQKTAHQLIEHTVFSDPKIQGACFSISVPDVIPPQGYKITRRDFHFWI